MTYFFGAKRVHKITTGKSYDELLHHDNKMRIWARSEEIQKSGKSTSWVTKHNANANDDMSCLRDTPRYERQ